MNRLVLPKTYVSVGDGPLIFLAGPESCAETWRSKAIRNIYSQHPEIYLACPSRNLDEDLIREVAEPNRVEKYQLPWEDFYLHLAGEQIKYGAVMFWLPVQERETEIDKITGFHKPYARDTRRELGMFAEAIRRNPQTRVVVGGEKNFFGFDVIKRTFLEGDKSMQFYSTLEDTCNAAISKALSCF